MGDSRKRPLDSESDTPIYKKPISDVTDLTVGTNADGTPTLTLKLLIPSIAAGAIIGRNGDTINELQREMSSKIKMSKVHDCYPGTNERVCLISGQQPSVRAIYEFMIKKIREKPEPFPKPDSNGKTNPDRHKQVKLLVPNSTVGMIIGKNGSNVRSIQEKTGAFVQFSQKAKDTSLAERCVTIAGEPDSCSHAMDLIQEKIQEDPESGSCPNISYSDYQGPVASAYPTGSPYAWSGQEQSRFDGESTQLQTGQSTATTPLASMFLSTTAHGVNTSAVHTASLGSNIDALRYQHLRRQHAASPMPTGGLDRLTLGSQAGLYGVTAAAGSGASAIDKPDPLLNIRHSLLSLGYQDLAVEEILGALTTLIKHGVLSILTSLAGVGNSLSVIAGLLHHSAETGHFTPTATAQTDSGGPPAGDTMLGMSGADGDQVFSAAGPDARAYYGPLGATTSMGSALPSGAAGAPGTSHRGGDLQTPNTALAMYYAAQQTGAGELGVGMSSVDHNAAQQSPAAASAHSPAGMSSAYAAGVSAYPSDNQNSFGLGMTASGQQSISSSVSHPGTSSVQELKTEVELEVPNSLIGVVLGRGGSDIVRLQKFTSTNIQVSKKGVFAPGTSNRLVTISGESQNVDRAVHLIHDLLDREENLRAKRITSRT